MVVRFGYGYGYGTYLVHPHHRHGVDVFDEQHRVVVHKRGPVLFPATTRSKEIGDISQVWVS